MTSSTLKDWRYEIDFEGIAWAIFDREGETMNTLGRRPTEELAQIIQRSEDAAKNGEIKGLIFMSAKSSSFIAGADIREFDHMGSEAAVADAVKATIGLFDRIEKMSVPVVAAIHGFCLGGGLEFAMACHYRIADREEATRLGLPEVKLGIFPGLNGTVRSVRLAGPLSAMEMMLTGRMLRPEAAAGMGLVDQLVPTHHRLRWAARKAVLKKTRSKGAPWWKKAMRLGPARGLIASQMRKRTAAKVREEHYPAPFRLIDLFEKYGGDDRRMAAAETRYFAPLMVSETAGNLRRVFRLTEMLKKEAPQEAFAPQRVHVIGAGTMGGDIAAWCVVCGMEVSLQDLSKEQIDVALARAKKLFQKRLRKKPAVDAAMARLLPDVDGTHVARADVVIEAIVEKLEIKQKVFKSLENRLKPGAVLATNTSSLAIADIAAPLADPARLIGLHFFNPVASLPLVEVVRGAKSREEEVRKGCAFVTAIKKFPLICKDGPGFLVNRVLVPYMAEAVRRYQQGEPREKVDQAALKFGMPMGPLELADVVGLDISATVARELGAVPDGEETELDRLVKAGKLGKKSGEGIYKWEKGKPVREQMSFEEADLEKLGKELVKPMLDECERCLADKVVESADHVDAGVIFGTGFAPFRGGPLHYLATRDGGGKAAAAA
ncbi:MAG: 3-hydroxyacyl-CoA dehydrogenase NAD-binding domain-containing protein [Pseudomonadota bacterium]|nr:3-hydroxyacyl-CoA dehydrogenase NAD-binding domain-containing protein [Pseudomonadota bacterium]